MSLNTSQISAVTSWTPSQAPFDDKEEEENFQKWYRLQDQHQLLSTFHQLFPNHTSMARAPSVGMTLDGSLAESDSYDLMKSTATTTFPDYGQAMSQPDMGQPEPYHSALESISSEEFDSDLDEYDIEYEPAPRD